MVNFSICALKWIIRRKCYAIQKEIKEFQKGDPYQWGEDMIARTLCVWTVNEGDKIGKEYDDQVSKIAFDQMLIGGLRLAKIMNDLFD